MVFAKGDTVTEKKVTIITPTYNRRDLLEETIKSVLKQDYPHIEYIVLDDGSNDDTQQVVEPYLDRLRYTYHDNMGETATVNKGFDLASGEIICVINSDDPFYSIHAVSTAVKVLENHPDALMAYTDWVSIDGYGKDIHFQKVPQYTLETMIKNANVSLGPGMFIRKSTIEKVGKRSPSVKYIGDLEYSFRCAAAGEIVHIPEYLATHRVHDGAASNTGLGPRMAEEVLSLIHTYIDHPNVRLTPKQKKQAIARWYFEAMYFAGKNRRLKYRYLFKALLFSVGTVMKMTRDVIVGTLYSLYEKIVVEKPDYS